MKKICFILSLAALLFSSCDREDNVEPTKGAVQFSFGRKQDNSGGRPSDSEIPSGIAISIRNAEGQLVVENEVLNLLSFGHGYVSESLELAPGNYAVTSFLVLDDTDNTLYATPLEGSELASLVEDPLPVSFTVSENNGTVLALQVVDVTETDTPEDFGYASFTFDIVINPSRQIEIIFRSSPNPNYQTEGYDSVTVTFTTSSHVITKKLNVVSPVEARGWITAEELGITSTNTAYTDVSVSAYYESIDVVPYNVHVLEDRVGAEIAFTSDSRYLKIDDLNVRSGGSLGEYVVGVQWDHQSHLTDITGYFHFTINNDPCNPLFTYTIFKNDVVNIVYDKLIMDEGDHFATSSADNSSGTTGTFVDEITFANMCPSTQVGTLYTDLTFYVVTPSKTYSCYLVWYYEDTPVDPEKNLTGSKPTGIFKVVSPEEFESLNRNQRSGRNG
jgi:hypothetical protein